MSHTYLGELRCKHAHDVVLPIGENRADLAIAQLLQVDHLSKFGSARKVIRSANQGTVLLPYISSLVNALW